MRKEEEEGGCRISSFVSVCSIIIPPLSSSTLEVGGRIISNSFNSVGNPSL